VDMKQNLHGSSKLQYQPKKRALSKVVIFPWCFSVNLNALIEFSKISAEFIISPDKFKILE
jgi:hypothetical protein